MRPEVESLQKALLVDTFLLQGALVILEAVTYRQANQLAIVVERLGCDDRFEPDISLFSVLVDLGCVKRVRFVEKGLDMRGRRRVKALENLTAEDGFTSGLVIHCVPHGRSSCHLVATQKTKGAIS